MKIDGRPLIRATFFCYFPRGKLGGGGKVWFWYDLQKTEFAQKCGVVMVVGICSGFWRGFLTTRDCRKRNGWLRAKFLAG